MREFFLSKKKWFITFVPLFVGLSAFTVTAGKLTGDDRFTILFWTLALFIPTYSYYFWHKQWERIKLAFFNFFLWLFVGYIARGLVVMLFGWNSFDTFGGYLYAILSMLPSSGEGGEIPTVVGGSSILFGLFIFLAIGGAVWSFFGKGDRYIFKLEDGIFHRRGRKLLSGQELTQSLESTMIEGEDALFWGLNWIPMRISTTHFAAIGSTGSGKTLTIRFMMEALLHKIKEGSEYRALIYDAKQDMLPVIAGINPSCPVYVMNPFDKRCVAWDMAQDITSPATAQQIATILIPENTNASQPFFSDAARDLLSGVFVSFIRNAPNNWTFRDVIYTLKSKSRLIEVLSACEYTVDKVEQYFSDDTSSRNVMSTIATKIQRYEFIAAAWERSETAISLRWWLTSNTILVLGNDEATRTALDALNKVIFKRLSELILDQSESSTRRTFVFLDELRQAGKLDGLSSLLTKGRSKGASVVVGYQDIEGLREVYGHQLASEIAGQCSNKAVLRCDSSDTAKWAASLFGEQEVLERRFSSSEGKSGKIFDSITGGSTQNDSTSISEHVTKREVVLPSEIMNIPPVTSTTGLKGYYITPMIGAYEQTVNSEWISNNLSEVRPDVMAGVDPRPDEDQYLTPWTEEDRKRLNLNVVSKQKEDKPVNDSDPSSGNSSSIVM